MHAQQLGHLLAIVGLPTRQEVEHLPAQLFMAVMFTLETLYESRCLFSDRGNRSAHGLPSTPGVPRSLWQGRNYRHRGQSEFIIHQRTVTQGMKVIFVTSSTSSRIPHGHENRNFWP